MRPRLPLRRAARAGLTLCLTIAAPSVSVLAQVAPVAPVAPMTPPRTDGFAPAAMVGINVAIGAGVAGVHAWHGRRPVARALWQGALGGAVMAGGFGVSAWHADVARLAAGQVVAVGASMARNAGRGAGLVETLTFPLSPLLVEHQRDSTGQGGWRVRLSAGALWGVVERGAARQGMQLDWAATGATGAPVFRTSAPGFSAGVNCPEGVACRRAGNSTLGTIAYDARRTPAERQATLSHEAVHVAQRSRDLILFGAPLGNWLAARGGPVRHLGRLFVLDGLMPLNWIDQASARRWSGYQSWYEREARTVAPGSAASFRNAIRP